MIYLVLTTLNLSTFLQDPDLTVVPVIGFIQNLEISKLRIDSNEVIACLRQSLKHIGLWQVSNKFHVD